MDIRTMHAIKNITITPEILKLIADIDEFKGRWKVIESLAPEKLTSLRRIATIESVGSSTRIEGPSSRMPRWRNFSPGCTRSLLPVGTRRKLLAMPMRWT